MRVNRAKRLLLEDKVAIGHMIMEFGTRGIAKLAEFGNPDYITLEMEHNAWGLDKIADLIAWFKATEIPIIVRVPENLYTFLAGVLDAGALGVQVANIETAEDALKVVSAVKYAPLGNRGVGLTAAHTDFITPKSAEYMPAANAETLLIVQVETAKGVENADEIAAIDGVDVLLIGHNDLTHSLGIHGQFGHPKFKEAIKKVVDAARRHGKAAGIHPLNEKEIEEYVDLGFRMIIGDSDITAYKKALKESVDTTRKIADRALLAVAK